MRSLIRHACRFSILVVLPFFLSSCGFLEKDEPAAHYDRFYDDPYYYVPGDSLAGGDFTFQGVTVDAYIWDIEENKFLPVSDGSYVPPGNYKLAIDPSMRREPNMLETEFEDLNDLMQGEPMDQRVYAGDGGNFYLVEAFYDEESGFYLCDFEIDGTYTTFTLLIEVLYPDRMTKKEKIIINTRNNVRAPVNEIVKEGIGVTINTNFMKNMMTYMMNNPEELKLLLGFLGKLFCDMEFPKVTDMLDKESVTSLMPNVMKSMSIKPGEDTLMDISMFNGKANMGITIEDIYKHGDEMDGGMPISIPVFTSNNQLSFLDDLGYNLMTGILPMMAEPIALNIDAIVTPSLDTLRDVIIQQAAVTGMNEYMLNMGLELLDSAFPLNMTAYMNAFAKPEENTDNMSVLFAGSYIADAKLLPTPTQLQLSGRCFPDWPKGVTINDIVSLDIAPIKRESVDIGIAMSGYEINSIVKQIGSIWVVPMPQILMSQLLIVMKVDDASSNVTGTLAFNPEGITIDFLDSEGEASALLRVNKLVTTFWNNGAPMCIMNMDAGFKMTVSLEVDGNDDLIMNLKLKIIPSQMRLHVFEDTMGLAFLDKSSFTKSMFDLILAQQMTLKEETEFNMPLNLTDMAGIKARKEGTNLMAENGNCYMSMALDDEMPFNFERLNDMAGGCFISTIRF